MKKLSYILFLLLIALVVTAPANSTNVSLTFAWDDDNIKGEDYGWLVFMRGEGETYDYNNPAIRVDYEDGQLEYTATGVFEVTGPANSDVAKYFVVRARSGELTSEDSNEVGTEIRIPINSVFNLTVIIRPIAE